MQMEISSDQLQGQERLRILAEKNDLSDLLFTILTSAGYDTISAVAMLDKDLNSLQSFYRENSQLFSACEREKLYSKCNNCPENFILLPGHRIKLQSFILICQQETLTQYDNSIIIHKRKIDELAEDPLGLLANKKFKSKSPRKSEGVIIADQESIDDVLALTQDKLQKAFQRWQIGHPLEYIRALDKTRDYEVSVTASNQDEKNTSLIATVSCSNCNCAVKMTINRSGNFCISNATRHLVKCFSKQQKISRLEDDGKGLNVSNMVIIKNEGMNNNDSGNNDVETNGHVVPLLMHNYTVVPVTQAGEVVGAEFAEITCIPELPM